MALPSHVKYLIIGAGVHGLSTAFHLSLELNSRGKGGGADILVVDKSGIAAGASGIACGVIRNNYFQPCASPKAYARRNLVRFVLVSARKRSLNSVKVCVEECEGFSAGEPGCTRLQRIYIKEG